MGLKLAIENVTQLADGGPVSITVQGKRGLDIGRDQHLDWTLPDPNRFISGKHCEIRFEGDAFVLHDVSVNGTFINDSPNRMREPHRLRDKDRILIGQYIIMVSLDAESGLDQSAPNTHPPSQANLWDSGEEAPAPIDPRELKLLGERTKKPDFLDWAVDVFDPLQPAPLT
jgi:type VI secretion system protein ImpI